MAETQDGGLYIVDGKFVDAEGKPTKRVASDGDADQADEFEGMSKDELVAAAEKRDLTVTRADGKDGVPTKDDYLAALRA